MQTMPALSDDILITESNDYKTVFSLKNEKKIK